MKKKLQLNPEQLKIVNAYQEIFKTEFGKVVLKDLEVSFDRDVFVKGDPYETHLRIGRRDVVLRIKEMINMEFEPVKEVENETEK